ncbi:MAG: hypothetical protein M1294_12230 [Firmicutes bacterium]|jgi:hypothetical protein|uniref:Uncharacterized protein n=1 Tax=Sulfobacillus benefaciens TaxID=453960 RepID=A0A2T2X7Y3_9FIRM|nr:hypothetical protein [Bacillota bacterium]MCL5014091.1 hypothetical protein [Bacillota bacterium]PSR30566.1 MAG: hypothetical protein C7B43_05670 [Sulfobacillus benefaciens]HBQ95136.1 hypothetical protein [Sulfobacillus sp.]
MALLIAGIIEALVGVALGLYLLIGQPSINGIWGWGLIGIGMLTGILSMLLGRQSRSSPGEDHLEPSLDSSRGEPQAPAYSLPEHQFDLGGVNAVSTQLPDRIGYLQTQISRTRWRYKAKDIHTRAVEVAEIVMKNHADGEPRSYDERPRQFRRLLELFILSQGYEAWANGVEPSFQVERYRRMLSKQDIAERMVDLTTEADLLWQEINRGGIMADLPDDDAHRQAIDVRIRLEHMTSAQDRLEEIEILQRGYASLFEQWEHDNRDSETEGR